MSTLPVTSSGKMGGLPRGVPALEKGQVHVRMTMEVTAVLEQDAEAGWVKLFGAALVKHGQRLISREVHPPLLSRRVLEQERTYLLILEVDGVERGFFGL